MNRRAVALPIPILPITMLLLSFVLKACAETKPVHLRNPQTGQEVICGPYPNYALRSLAGAQQESQCIQDFEKQGFVRLPKTY